MQTQGFDGVYLTEKDDFKDLGIDGRMYDSGSYRNMIGSVGWIDLAVIL